MRPKMRKLQGVEHFRRASEMGLMSACDILNVSLDLAA